MHSSDLQIEQAARLLAKRAAVVRLVPRREKIAAYPGTLSSLGEMWNATPTAAKGALIGAGVGGLGGYASQAFSDQDEEDKRPWGSALTGALAGGAVGGGLGLAAPQLKKLYQAHQLDRQIGDLEYRTRPGVGAEVTDSAIDAASGYTPSIAATVAYHAHRKMPEHLRGRLVDPADVFARAQAGDRIARDFVERTTAQQFVDAKKSPGSLSEYSAMRKSPGVASGPGWSQFEEALKKTYRDARGEKPSAWSTTKMSPSGVPFLRREWDPIRRVFRTPGYSMTGMPSSRWRGLAGTIAAMGLPIMAQRLFSKAMPSGDQAQLEELYRRRAAMAAQ